MHVFLERCRSHLAEIRAQGRYRRFTPLTREAARFPVYTILQDGQPRTVTVWSSNDYLAMGVDPVTIDGARTALESLGAGAGRHPQYRRDLAAP